MFRGTRGGSALRGERESSGTAESASGRGRGACGYRGKGWRLALDLRGPGGGPDASSRRRGVTDGRRGPASGPSPVGLVSVAPGAVVLLVWRGPGKKGKAEIGLP